ncbi:MAG TPA: polysaccharide deacetylase family protein [Chitinophagaceae bacterium]|jgi:peptidoglycan/xylan/chitin deacetylase (PgdA/CDA1 family)
MAASQPSEKIYTFGDMNNKCFCLLSFSFFFNYNNINAQTEITKWQDGKTAALSLTYDDGSINQFRYALPIMKRLKLPATFYIITGSIQGSQYRGKFIGRPVEDIIAETATVPTNADNYFERASAAKYLGYTGANAYYDSSAILYEDGNEEQAHKVMDSLYSKVRNGSLKKGTEPSMEVAQEKGLTWDSIKLYASEGYEFASHTITHAHMAVLDTANMFYELEKSKEDIKNQLGEKYTFTAEIPFGIEHPRAMKYSLPAYAALRNMMTDPYMQEINRGYKTQPGSSGKEYVQWQRGATTKTSLELMQSWIDTTLAHDNIWLVLVFHGVDGVGYEALPHELLDTYFQYIKKQEDRVWIATFSDVAKYMRERMHASVNSAQSGNRIVVHLQHSLDTGTYDIPLTLKTYVPKEWKNAEVKQDDHRQQPAIQKDTKGNYILYQTYPNRGDVELSQK